LSADITKGSISTMTPGDLPIFTAGVGVAVYRGHAVISARVPWAARHHRASADSIGSPDPENQKEWSSPRFREILKAPTRTGLHGTAINIQAYRDIAIAIRRRYGRGSSPFRSHIEGDEEAGIPDIDDEDE
jgi:hypothetical protein